MELESVLLKLILRSFEVDTVDLAVTPDGYSIHNTLDQVGWRPELLHGDDIFGCDGV